MKRNRKIVFLLVSVFNLYFPTILFAQETFTINPVIKFKYSLLYQADSTDTQSLEDENFVLLYDKENQKYIFLPEGIFYRDSIMQHGDPTTILGNLSRIRHNINYSVYVDLKGKETVVKGYLNSQKGVFYQEKLPKIDWKLSDSTRIKGHFILKKAEATFGGRHWTAWYAPSVPYSIGPYKFYGLPGTIVMLYDDKGQYKFELTRIVPIKQRFSFSMDLSHAQEIDKKDFLMNLDKIVFNYKMAYLKSRNVKIRTQDGKTLSSGDLIQKAYKKIQERNNPIELPE